MIARTDVKELATGRADSAIATSPEPEEVPDEPEEGDWDFLAESLGVDRDELEELEVDDGEHPRDVKTIFERNYQRRLRQEFGEGFGPS